MNNKEWATRLRKDVRCTGDRNVAVDQSPRSFGDIFLQKKIVRDGVYASCVEDLEIVGTVNLQGGRLAVN